MTKTISQLFNGNLMPIKNFGKNNSEIKQLEHLMNNNLEKLEETFSDRQKDIFERYNECINEYIIIITEQAFSDGFSIATKLLTEAINEAENLQ